MGELYGAARPLISDWNDKVYLPFPMLL